MRLWTLHPRYLDGRGLVALWREALLAQAVLQGRSRGYRHHPQLLRFRAEADPVAAVATYLQAVLQEGSRRGYAFDGGKIAPARPAPPLRATRGQLAHERSHLLAKLATRDPERFARLAALRRPQAHPLFRIVGGEVESWERGAAPRDLRPARQGGGP